MSIATTCHGDSTPAVAIPDTSQQAPVSDEDFFLPWPNTLDPVEVLQGNQTRSGRTHFEGGWEQFAFDFAVPEAEPVLAARGGTVTYVHDDYEDDHCGGREFKDEPNLVIVDHGDGTSGQYLHLQKGISVNVGQDVLSGQMLGAAGKTGATGCTPHLHFQVQENDSVRKLPDGTERKCSWSCESISICFVDIPDCVPQEGRAYQTLNQMVMVEGIQVTREPNAIIATESTKCPPSELIQPDPQSVAEWTTCAVLLQDLQALGRLVGTHGASYSPYGVEAFLPEYNNSAELMESLKQELELSNPVCAGYEILYGGIPDKLSVWFDGITLSNEHFGNEGSGFVNFLFFKFDKDYELVGIIPSDRDLVLSMSGGLIECFSQLPVPVQTLDHTDVGYVTEVVEVNTPEESRLILEDGTICGLLGGGTRAFGNDRLNYICGGSDWWLLGEPTMDAVWTIRAAILTDDTSTIIEETRLNIRKIWYWECC